jgi:hypothetical protein
VTARMVRVGVSWLNTDRMAAESVIYDAAALCIKQNKMEMQATGDVH